MEPRTPYTVTLVGEDTSIPATGWDLEASGEVSRRLAKGLTVKQEDWKADHWFGFDRTQPQSKWIDRSELPLCS